VEAAYDQECVVGYKKRRGYEGETRIDMLLPQPTTTKWTKTQTLVLREDLDVSRHALARILQDDLKADRGRVLKGPFVLVTTWIDRDF
jgi:hypothetical protein